MTLLDDAARKVSIRKGGKFQKVQASPMKLEFEANLLQADLDVETIHYGSVLLLKFGRVDGEGPLKELTLRRFKVTLEEIKDW